VSFDDDNNDDSELEEYWIPEVGRFEELPEELGERIIEEFGARSEEFTEYAEFDPFAGEQSDELEEEQEEAEGEAEEIEFGDEALDFEEEHPHLDQELDGSHVIHIFDTAEEAENYCAGAPDGVLAFFIDENGDYAVVYEPEYEPQGAAA